MAKKEATASAKSAKSAEKNTTAAAKATAKAAKPAKSAEKKSVEKPEKVMAAEKPAKAPKLEAAAETTEKPAKAVKAVKPKRESAAARAAAEELSEDFKKWSDLKEKHGQSKAVNYNLSSQFEAQIPLMHKVLGWGYILSNQNDRLEVLFETGRKTLISNYKTAK